MIIIAPLSSIRTSSSDSRRVDVTDFSTSALEWLSEISNMPTSFSGLLVIMWWITHSGRMFMCKFKLSPNISRVELGINTELSFINYGTGIPIMGPTALVFNITSHFLVCDARV